MDGLKGVTGAVVALDPSTGAILGLASTPSFDPNQLSSHDPAAIRAYAKQLRRRPTTNQAISSATRPARCSRWSCRPRPWPPATTPRRPRSRRRTS